MTGRTFFACLLSLGAWFAVVAPAAAETSVQSGDTVSIQITEAPEMDRVSVVDPDGRVVLAGLGGIAIAGHGPEAIARIISAALQEANLIRSPTVFVDVTEWRPVYADGRVRRPGSYEYSHGFTVRQLIIAAGGLDLALPSGSGGGLSPNELLAERKAVAYRLFQAEVLIAGLQEDLGLADAATAFDRTAVSQLTDQEADDVIRLDAALRAGARRKFEEEKSHLRKAGELLDFELTLLEQRSALQQEEQARQDKEMATARELRERGLVPASRITDLARENATLSSGILETRSFAARARQERAANDHKVLVAETERDIALRTALSNALASRANLKAQLEVIELRIVQSAQASEEAQQPMQPVTSVTIHRMVDGASRSIPASMASLVEPGDVIEVAFLASPKS